MVQSVPAALTKIIIINIIIINGTYIAQVRKGHKCAMSAEMAVWLRNCPTTTFAKGAFRCSAPAVWNSLPQTVLSRPSDSVAVFKSRLKNIPLSQAFSSFLLTNTLPGPSASEVTTLWRYTNLSIIITATCLSVCWSRA